MWALLEKNKTPRTGFSKLGQESPCRWDSSLHASRQQPRSQTEAGSTWILAHYSVQKKSFLSADSWPVVPFPPAANIIPRCQHPMATPQSVWNTLHPGPRALSSSSKSCVWLEMGSFSIFKDASIIWKLSKSFPYNFHWKRWDGFRPQESVQMVTHEAPIPQSFPRWGH